MLIPRLQNIRRLCAAANTPFYVTTPIFYVNAGKLVRWHTLISN